MEDLLGQGRRVPLRGAARIMAERMAEAHRMVPQVTVVIEADVAPLEAAVAAGHPGRPSILGLISLATLAGLAEEPIFNASFDEQAVEIVFHEGVDLGIAVQSAEGLRVATIRGADRLAADSFQAELNRLVEAGRRGQLASVELAGSTFTISSGGKLGGLLATPLVNWPNLAILGVHAIEDRAVVREGKVEVGRRANLSLSFDHRVIDGMTASAFLHRLAARLGDPEALG
jgi:pyruvate/2-oxoglutarate dehydrogenase complex dihydrolipoamide acyltransferase (E2) component